ncbi:amino acid adenylation domain-containing protein [Actinocrispum wychmicini]|uniref:Nonribosomal peptide synthetase DhbF n=1 Tax=Actinocrispum wychmicini TaxID=1213861 RepID=A0A4V2S883_9PSEU|nr:amino acid adenylation domain-containing protein [Actinocrispum wychmicini]TCO62830.1 nonribosomal peptide synthetase DhbF [Actinocrispum wychmicini]
MFDLRCKTLHEQFSESARQWPERTALLDEEGALTYREVDDLSGELAQVLRSLSMPGECVIGLRMSRTRFTPAGMLGILRAGCGYLPVDPDYPAARRESLLEDSRARLIVTDGPAEERETVLTTVGPFTVVERDQAQEQDTVDDLAYVIYTSGSTGRPKGCPVSHANVMALFGGCAELFDVGPEDVWTVFHSASFDFSVWELWGALLTGASAVLVPKQVSVDPEAFAQLLSRRRVTVLSQTPSSFNALIRALPAGERLDDLRYIVFGGEALRPGDVIDWFDRGFAPAAELINMYGITETTVHVTYRPLTPQLCRDARSGRTPIGVPLPHLRVSLRDERGQPVTDGQPGEMWVAGDGVTQGYLRRASLTAERFVSDDLDGADQFYYRSGDWAVRDEHGELYFIGRQDSQVKLRGFRIELGEIEAVLAGLAGVRAAACDVEATAAGHEVLVARVVLEPDALLTKHDIRRYASAQLPAHMRPHQIRTCARLALTANGKFDRHALRSAR